MQCLSSKISIKPFNLLKLFGYLKSFCFQQFGPPLFSTCFAQRTRWENLCLRYLYIQWWNIVMDAYGKKGMIIDKRNGICTFSHEKYRCKFDIITSNLLIDSCGKKQAYDKMEQVFKSSMRFKEKPTLPTFSSITLNWVPLLRLTTWFVGHWKQICSLRVRIRWGRLQIHRHINFCVRPTLKPI